MGISNVNTFKYTDSGKQEYEVLRKDNWWIGTNDVGKGPTIPPLGFWNGHNASGGTGYRMYVYKASQGPSIRYAKFDSDLITYTNQLPGATNFTSTTECFVFFDDQPDYALLNYDIPAVITSGATLYLEPYNVICNSRMGKWNNLAQNFNFNAINSPLSVVSLGGVFQWGFEFDGQNYWQYSTDPSLIDMAGDCTLIMWLYSIGARNVDTTLFQKNGTVYAAWQQEIMVDWDTNDRIVWYSRYDANLGSDIGYTAVLNSGWNMVGIKMSTGKTTAARDGYYSINGGTWTQNYTSNTNQAITPAGSVVIGTGDTGTVEEGGIGLIMTYDRMLSDSEINKFFQATRGLYNV